jgi:hypothetical protein
VQLPATASGLLVPNAALQRQAGQAGVWRLAADGKPAWIPVKVGATGLDGMVRVDAEGLAEGDRVVQHSQKPVQAGIRLQVVDADYCECKGDIEPDYYFASGAMEIEPNASAVAAPVVVREPGFSDLVAVVPVVAV